MDQSSTVTRYVRGERGAVLVESSLAILPYLMILAAFLVTAIVFSALSLCTSTALHAELARTAFNVAVPAPEINNLVVGFQTDELQEEARVHQTTAIRDPNNRHYIEFLNFSAGVLNRIGYPIGYVESPEVSSAWVEIRRLDPSNNDRTVKEVHIATTILRKLGVHAGVLSSDSYTGPDAPPVVSNPVPTDPDAAVPDSPSGPVDNVDTKPSDSWKTPVDLGPQLKDPVKIKSLFPSTDEVYDSDWAKSITSPDGEPADKIIILAPSDNKIF